ncbi:MAG TPA: ATP synthase F1 subunit gamma [Candidatus Moranbacteria bacterium]|nr:ATP synthase F1 subunit gamma [Candidatus Moranbacteria bacterium]
MASGKEIRRRIKSIKNTGKITRAMEMVSAAKMRRAIASVLAIRPYAHSAWSILTNLARSFEKNQEGLLEVREVKRILAIVITSNRGLCGSFNSQIARKIKEELDNPEKLKINRIGTKKLESKISNKDLAIDFITIGKKGEVAIRKAGNEIIASFNDLAYLPKIDDVRAIGKIVIQEYLAKKYDKVVIFYTDYVSTINQQTKVRQILPLSKIDLEKQIAEMDVLAKEYGLSEPIVEYKIEPSPIEVLKDIIPRLIEMQVYHAILESNASKESAQMIAMKNATEASEEMAMDLTLAYNQIRQMKITQEIAEISAGRAALEN